ncbi:MAG: alanine--tRNA ligase [Aridibacter sp.]
MKGNEIRQKFIEYFEKHGHKSVHSSPLLPANDPTLLFVNAGMNQFKDVFLGNEKRDYTRATSSQKCIRAGGKHNDLDEVGKTARHHTFFEMLGNFSFGDYFKEDAIKFAWDFLAGSIEEGKLGLDPKYLWFTYFEGDENVPADTEARDLWIKMGADPSRVLPFDAKDNFWQMGDTGPCGPCSEIHYYMGDEPDNPEKNRPEYVNAETGDDTIEIWNLVFMQFDKDADGKLHDLPAPSVDTGAGLERLAAVMQGKSNNYDTDLMMPIIKFVAKISDKKYEYDLQEGFAMRVVADHARTTAFAIADGILPGNEGRNYVLRKIMRRAIYHGREHLGFEGLFFHKVCDFVVGEMNSAYPELETQREFIGKMVKLEEERFGNTLTVGLKKLQESIDFYFFSSEEIAQGVLEDKHEMMSFNFKVERNELKEERNFWKNYYTQNRTDEVEEDVVAKEMLISAIASYIEHPNNIENFLISDLAKLYDTFGTPKDLILLTLRENGFDLSGEKFDEIFDKAIKELQENSAIGKTQQNEKINPIYKALERQGFASNFHGYELTKVESAKVVAIVKGDEKVDELEAGEEGLIVLDETPFYAESGGQVGDRGDLFNQNAQVKVIDTFAPIAGIILHKSKIKSGSIKVGDVVTATVDEEKRDATRRNHTATHLVHAALKEVLGTHVKQAGSVVSPNYLRFDFTHYQAMSDAEVQEIEDLVNLYILQNEPVATDLMSIDDAMKSGAVAMFGEKYGSDVRVLSVGGGEFSKELCGGTHVRATGDIGLFKITADEAIASGVRRIRAITGIDAFKRFRDDEILIDKSLNVLNTQRDNLPNAIAKLQDELKQKRKEVDELKLKIATGAVGTSSNGDEAKEINGIKVMAKSVEDLDKGSMRHLSDTLMAKVKSGVVIIGNKNEGKVSFIVRVSDDLTNKIRAGNIIKEIAPIVGGKGGGKPDMAEGGGTEPEKLSEAIDASYGVIEKMLS